MNNIYPAKGFVLVELLDADSETESGVYIPEEAKVEKPMKAKVLEIGLPRLGEGGVVLEAPDFSIGTNEDNMGGIFHKLKKGDTIFYDKHTQKELPIPGSKTKLAFLAFERILGLKFD